MPEPLLPFASPCRPAVFLRRVKRFSVECLLEGAPCWAHTNNSGSMLGLLRPGASIWLSAAPGKNRKLPYTLEIMELPDGRMPAGTFRVGVNTMTPNRLLRAAFYAGRLPWAVGYTEFRAETRRNDSRIDALLTGPGRVPLWVECKNVTLVEDDVAAFPDAVSARAQKHVAEMSAIARAGERAAFFYCVQRPDGRCFGPADYIDPAYAALYHESLAAGVEVYAHRVPVSPDGIDLGPCLPLSPQP